MDEEPAICRVIRRIAESLGFQVQTLHESAAFVQALQEFRPSLLILDLKMPGSDGVQLLQQVSELQRETQVIVTSGMEQRVLKTAEKLGRSRGLSMLGVLQKPLQLAELELRLNEALSASRPYSRADLAAGLAERQFHVLYQPKITRYSRTWKIEGAEALVRWMHPVRGLLPPSEFPDLLEEYRLIAQLTDYVFETAIGQVAEWSARDMSFAMAVNLSASLIQDSGFPDRMSGVLERHGVPGHMLTIELTESTAMADPTAAMDILLRLCVNDVSLSIDEWH